jgi:hypothetical protein
MTVLALSVALKQNKKIAYLGAVGTMLTIPYVWFVFPVVFWSARTVALPVAELFAFLVEACIYKFYGKVHWKIAVLFSFVANLMSYMLWELM